MFVSNQPELWNLCLERIIRIDGSLALTYLRGQYLLCLILLLILHPRCSQHPPHKFVRENTSCLVVSGTQETGVIIAEHSA